MPTISRLYKGQVGPILEAHVENWSAKAWLIGYAGRLYRTDVTWVNANSKHGKLVIADKDNLWREKPAFNTAPAISVSSAVDVSQDQAAAVEEEEGDGKITAPGYSSRKSMQDKLPKIVDTNSLMEGHLVYIVPLEGQQSNLALPSDLLLRFSRTYAYQHEDDETPPTTMKVKVDGKTVECVISALRGRTEIATQKEVNPLKMIKACVLLEQLDIVVLKARVMAWLRLFFIEQKNCPCDTVLACVWEHTQPGSRLRQLLLASVYRRLYLDSDADFGRDVPKFELMYEGIPFTDARRGNWFEALHKMVLSTLVEGAQRRTFELLDTTAHNEMVQFIRFTRPLSGLMRWLKTLKDFDHLANVKERGNLVLDFPLSPCSTTVSSTRKDHLRYLQNSEFEATATSEFYDLPQPDLQDDGSGSRKDQSISSRSAVIEVASDTEESGNDSSGNDYSGHDQSSKTTDTKESSTPVKQARSRTTGTTASKGREQQPAANAADRHTGDVNPKKQREPVMAEPEATATETAAPETAAPETAATETAATETVATKIADTETAEADTAVSETAVTQSASAAVPKKRKAVEDAEPAQTKKAH